MAYHSPWGAGYTIEPSHHHHEEGRLERADRLALGEYLEECPAARVPLVEEANGHRLTGNPPSWLQTLPSRGKIMDGAGYVTESQSAWWKILAPRAIGTFHDELLAGRFWSRVTIRECVNQDVYRTLRSSWGLGCKMVRKGFKKVSEVQVFQIWGGKDLYVSSST